MDTQQRDFHATCAAAAPHYQLGRKACHLYRVGSDLGSAKKRAAIVLVSFQCNTRLSIYPTPPLLPFAIRGTCAQPRISHCPEIRNLLPRLSLCLICSRATSQNPPRIATTMARPAIPAGLLHQTLDRLFLIPPLLHRHIWQICCAMSPATVCETYPDPMAAKFPVHGITAWLEVRQQGERAGERGKMRCSDG